MAKATLSAIFQQAKGVLGNEVVTLSRSGIVIRSKPKYRQGARPETAGARARLIQTKDAWYSLSLEQIEAWRDYASTITKHAELTGKTYSPIAYNVFTALTTRFLQVNPTGTIPLWPPKVDFVSDGVTLEIEPLEEGGVRFIASGPNQPDSTTELMVQKLPSFRRTPTQFYKSAAFHRFTEDDLIADMPLEPGAYAFCYRFIHAPSGQTGPQLGLGMVIVDEVVAERVAA